MVRKVHFAGDVVWRDALIPEHAFPDDLEVQPVGRWPTTLPPATVRSVLERPLPTHISPADCAHQEAPPVTVVVVTFDNLVFTRLCLESLLSQLTLPAYEVIVVDNASNDGTLAYLDHLSRQHPAIRPIFNHRNSGFAAATNQGLRAARGDILVLLNDDTIVTPGWLACLANHLQDPSVGLVGPVTNWSHNETQIGTTYRTFAELLDFADNEVRLRQGQSFEVDRLAMFCCAMRRDLWRHIGPLDERFEVGMFEDTDYAMRVRRAGYRILCAQAAFVHHFGQASIGKLLHDGTYYRLFHANRRRFEFKWQRAWQPPKRRSLGQVLAP